MLKTPIGRLRLVGLLEGSSYLVLLYCSIVLKRMQGHEEAINIPGYIHGGLFILLCLLLCSKALLLCLPLSDGKITGSGNLDKTSHRGPENNSSQAC